MELLPVSFKVKANLAFGEDIRVCGHVPAMGNLDPQRSIRLATTPKAYPWWITVEPLLLPQSDQIQYKYCIFSGGEFSRWENVPEPRVLELRKLVQQNWDQLYSVWDTIDDTAPQVPEVEVKSEIRRGSFGNRKSRSLRKLRSNQSRSDEPANISSNDGVVVVSYFLPIILKKEGDEWVAEWDHENLLSLQTHLRVTWVGSVRYKGAIPESEEDAVIEALRPLNCVPVFVDSVTHYNFYQRWCKGVIWPVLHHIADIYGPSEQSIIGGKEQQDFLYWYTHVNQKFRMKIVEVYHEGDLIWIHGFHLMLLPSFLRKVVQNARIGMFFHTPFPSSEIWRTLPFREELLGGILSADQIGFHLYEYARHFLTACRRLLGLHSEMDPSGQLTIDFSGRSVAITSIHVGVDLPQVNSITAEPEYLKNVQDIREKYAGKKIVIGIDRLERLKGVPLKLAAIERFWRLHPEWHDRLVFIQIGVSAHERGEDYVRTAETIRRLVHRINRLYSGEHPAVVFEERPESDVSLMKRMEWFAASDVQLIMAPRDGLNRMPIEFILAHNGEGHEPGVLVLSEFVSSARVMQGAVKVNPWRTDDVVTALQGALEMSIEERARRHDTCVDFATRQSTAHWALQVLLDLKRVNKEVDVNAESLGLGLGYRVIAMNAGFQQLDEKKCSEAYKQARIRLIMLDYGGTLVAQDSKSDKVKAYAVASKLAQRKGPSKELVNVLTAVCADQKNFVFVVSGQELSSVEENFGDIKYLGLAAEHGYYYRWPRDVDSVAASSASLPQWHTLVTQGDQSWKQMTKVIMDVYVQRTHGTYIEQKNNALLWQFRDADPEFGYLQSKELEDHLISVLKNFPVTVLRGGGLSDGYVEVRPEGVSKGYFLEHVLTHLKSGNRGPDFLFCAGDDQSDEPMFDVALRLKDTGENIKVFSVTIGKKPSHALSYLPDVEDVLQVLVNMTRLSSMSSKFHSMVDFRQVSSDLPSPSPPASINRAASSSPYTGMGSKSYSMTNLDGAQGLAQDRPVHSRKTSQTIMEYMNKIDEGDNDEEDDGVFF